MATCLLVAAAACGDEPRDGSTAGDVRSRGTSAASSFRDAGEAGVLCDRIDDDEALTPPGAERLEMPDLASLNGERRCVFLLAADMSIEETREFYRTGLSDRGYSIADWTDGEGIVAGNQARTFIRATKSDLHVHFTIDAFDPEASPISDHEIQVKAQFDEVGG